MLLETFAWPLVVIGLFGLGEVCWCFVWNCLLLDWDVVYYGGHGSLKGCWVLGYTSVLFRESLGSMQVSVNVSFTCYNCLVNHQRPGREKPEIRTLSLSKMEGDSAFGDRSGDGVVLFADHIQWE